MNMIDRFFIKEIALIMLMSCVLYFWYVTGPNQVFDDCDGPDVPAHCVE